MSDIIFFVPFYLPSPSQVKPVAWRRRRPGPADVLPVGRRRVEDRGGQVDEADRWVPKTRAACRRGMMWDAVGCPTTGGVAAASARHGGSSASAFKITAAGQGTMPPGTMRVSLTTSLNRTG